MEDRRLVPHYLALKACLWMAVETSSSQTKETIEFEKWLPRRALSKRWQEMEHPILTVTEVLPRAPKWLNLSASLSTALAISSSRTPLMSVFAKRSPQPGIF